MTTRAVAVIGGGVSGLTAAYRLRQALGADISIDLYERSGRLGGLLNTTTVGGLRSSTWYANWAWATASCHRPAADRPSGPVADCTRCRHPP